MRVQRSVRSTPARGCETEASTRSVFRPVVRRAVLPRSSAVRRPSWTVVAALATALSVFDPAATLSDHPGSVPPARNDDGALRYRSESGRFEILMPAEPQVRSSSRLTPGGRVRTTEYLVERGALQYWVEHHDIPRLGSAMLTDGAILSRAKRDFLDDVGGCERGSTTWKLRDHPVREVVFELLDKPHQVGKALFTLVGRRLYLVATIYDRQDPFGERLERMIGTLEVWRR